MNYYPPNQIFTETTLDELEYLKSELTSDYPVSKARLNYISHQLFKMENASGNKARLETYSGDLQNDLILRTENMVAAGVAALIAMLIAYFSSSGSSSGGGGGGSSAPSAEEIKKKAELKAKNIKSVLVTSIKKNPDDSFSVEIKNDFGLTNRKTDLLKVFDWIDPRSFSVRVFDMFNSVYKLMDTNKEEFEKKISEFDIEPNYSLTIKEGMGLDDFVGCRYAYVLPEVNLSRFVECPVFIQKDGEKIFKIIKSKLPEGSKALQLSFRTKKEMDEFANKLIEDIAVAEMFDDSIKEMENILKKLEDKIKLNPNSHHSTLLKNGLILKQIMHYCETKAVSLFALQIALGSTDLVSALNSST